MKLKVILTLGFLMVSVCCYAADIQFWLYYHAWGATSGCTSKIFVECQPDATDGYDGEYRLDTRPDWQSPVMIAFHKINGVDGWDTDTGFYQHDIRAPLPPGGSLTINDIYFWAYETTPSQNLWLELDSYIFSPGISGTISLVGLPEGVSYNGPTIWAIPHSNIVLPFYSTRDGTTGYEFKITLSAVPEPSSLLALASCLLPVGVSVMRRRRK